MFSKYACLIRIEKLTVIQNLFMTSYKDGSTLINRNCLLYVLYILYVDRVQSCFNTNNAAT